MDIPRTRDLVILVADQTIPVLVDDTMAQGGWVGGQYVQWASNADDSFLVTYSDGLYGGFLLWGSDESSDKYVASTGNQPTYKFATCAIGSWIVSTVAYEKYTLQSRLIPPLVENVYTVGEPLLISLRGYLTPQNEWTISGDPRAPNPYTIAHIVQAPTSDNSFQLMVQTEI